MAKENGEVATGILAGLQEAILYVRGEGDARVTSYVFADAKAIREQLGMSQSEFCKTYGISINTLQNWEQRRSNPDRTASAYLWAIAELPRQISEVQIRHRNEKAGGTETAAFY